MVLCACLHPPRECQQVIQVSTESSYQLRVGGEFMNNYTQLLAYPEVLKGEPVHMVRQPYSEHSARVHVKRLRDVLESPPLQSELLSPEAAAATAAAAPPPPSPAPAPPAPAATMKRLMAEHPVEDDPVPLDLSALPAMQHAAAMAVSSSAGAPVPACVQSLTFSGWNPPPPPRRLMGDLFYVFATTLEGAELHITATSAGFYVNMSRGDTAFNPTPAHTPHRAYSLVDLLSSASPKFRKNWAALCASAAEAPEQIRTPSAFPVALLQTFDGRPPTDSVGFNGLIGGLAFHHVPWLAAAMDKHSSGGGGGRGHGRGHARSSGHTHTHGFDMNRAEGALTESWGVADVACGRDWNSEYQSYRQMPSDTVEQRVERMRLLARLQADFVDAVRRVALRLFCVASCGARSAALLLT